MTCLFLTSIAPSTWTSFLLVHFGKGVISYDTLFYVGGGLSGLNLMIVYFLEEKEIISRES